MPRSYLVRFGLARSVALFGVAPESAGESPDLERLERGDRVVVRTHRGTELGEVLGAAPASFDPESPLVPQAGEDRPPGLAPLLRRATIEDAERARRADARRGQDYEAAWALLGGGDWPIDLVDAEPLLDEGRTVLHYLGPHRLDAADLVASFRTRFGLDVVLEPVGRDADDPADEVDAAGPPDDHPGCGSCGSKGGGCGSCASAGGCAVKALVGSRRPRPASIP